MYIKIKCHFFDRILFEGEYASIRHAVEAAVVAKIDLSGTRLDDARLNYASLDGASLDGAKLESIKQDMINAILKLPEEIPYLRKALAEGKIDGSTYTGECACLAGTMAMACGLDFENFRVSGMMPVNSESLRERWFLAIRPGMTPENSPVAAITLGWIDEALGRARVA